MITENSIKAALRKAQDAGKRKELKDDGERGAGRLALSVRPHKGGRVSAEWYAIYYRDGRRLMTKLGSYPTLSIADARKKFREEYAPAISAGGDVADSHFRKRSRSGPRDATVKALFEAYVASLRADGKRSARNVERLLLSDTSGAAKAIGEDKLASAVTPKDIVPLLSGIYERGSVAMAAAVRGYMSTAFAYGIMSVNSYTDVNAGIDWGITNNPVTAVPTDNAAHSPGDRFLLPHEFRTLWFWLIKKDMTSKLSPCIRLQMATGQRVEEILRISEQSYDRTERTLFWKNTKNKTPHHIPICSQATEILDALKPNKHGWLFPNKLFPEKPADYGGPNRVLISFIKESGVPHFTARDLRRTWKTISGRAGLDKPIRDKLQNHAMADVSSKHYDRWTYLPEMRAAVAQWEAFLTRILAGEFGDVKPAEVFQIGDARAA